jgi:hypothetical protein
MTARPNRRKGIPRSFEFARGACRRPFRTGRSPPNGKEAEAMRGTRRPWPSSRAFMPRPSTWRCSTAGGWRLPKAVTDRGFLKSTGEPCWTGTGSRFGRFFHQVAALPGGSSGSGLCRPKGFDTQTRAAFVFLVLPALPSLHARSLLRPSVDPARMGGVQEGPDGQWRVELLGLPALPSPDPQR